MNALELLKAFGPPLATVIIGGLVASLLIPRLQERFNRQKILAERRLDLLEKVTDTFPRYIISWKRLMEISELGSDMLSEEQIARRNEFVKYRNAHGEELIALLRKSQIYFTRSTYDRAQRFIDWDRSQTIKTLDELPDIEEWKSWEDYVLKGLMQEV